MSDAPILAQALITNPSGIHARPCVKLTKIAKTSAADVEIALSPDGPWVNAKSPVKVMRFRAPCNATLYFRASGPGAREIIDELLALAQRNFDEDGEGEPGHA